MTLPPTVAEILAKHVTLEVEGIDRMYLNLYVPILQREAGVAHFWIRHRGHRFASSALMDPMTKASSPSRDLLNSKASSSSASRRWCQMQNLPHET